MQRLQKARRRRTWLAAIMLVALAGSAAQAASERPMFVSLGTELTGADRLDRVLRRAPAECDTRPMEARDVVLTPTAWRDLVRVNSWVNTKIKPLTDMEHWGVVERWSYPDDGYGDCEDYVLLKRRMLIQAGWPRQALLITVVRDNRGDGHAVLTVKTDKGEFILDNQHEEILLWSETSYRFVKRQSQSDPNVWVSLGDPPPRGFHRDVALNER